MCACIYELWKNCCGRDGTGGRGFEGSTRGPRGPKKAFLPICAVENAGRSRGVWILTFLRDGWICVMVALQRQRLSQLLGGAGRLCDTSCETSYHGSQALLCPKTLNTIAILGGMRQQCSLHVCWYTCYVLQARCFGAGVLHVTKDLVPCALPLLDSSTLECREKQRRLKRVFGRQHFLTQRPTLGQVRSVRRTGREEVSSVLKARTTNPVVSVRGS